MKEIEKITLILSENDKELKNKIEELGSMKKDLHFIRILLMNA